MNPWTKIDYRDYEKHMSDGTVFQLQTLDLIIKSKVNSLKPPDILVLGSASGNGFGNFTEAEEVIAVDINDEFLRICEERYAGLIRKLTLINCDINSGNLPVTDEYADLIICHLFLEYVDLNRAFSEMKRVLKPGGVCNIIIQLNNNVPFVSNTGITSLNILNEIAQDVDEQDVEKLIDKYGFSLKDKKEFPLPNGKSFISYDFKLK